MGIAEIGFGFIVVVVVAAVIFGLGTLAVVSFVPNPNPPETLPVRAAPAAPAVGAAPPAAPAAAAAAAATSQTWSDFVIWWRSNRGGVLAVLSLLALLVLLWTVFPVILASLLVGVGWPVLGLAIVALSVALLFLHGKWLWVLVAWGILVLLLIAMVPPLETWGPGVSEKTRVWWSGEKNRPSPSASASTTAVVVTKSPAVAVVKKVVTVAGCDEKVHEIPLDGDLADLNSDGCFIRWEQYPANACIKIYNPAKQKLVEDCGGTYDLAKKAPTYFQSSSGQKVLLSYLRCEKKGKTNLVVDGCP